MRITGLLVTLGSFLVLASAAFSDPLMPTDLTPPVAGESPLIDPTNPPIPVTAYVDWIVLGPNENGMEYSSLITSLFGPAATEVPDATWVYLYQVEAMSDGLQIFTVTIPDVSSVLAFGSLSGIDLDSDAGYGEHNSGVYGNLATEHDPFTCCEPVDASNLGLADVSWEFMEPIIGVPTSGFRAGEESELLYIVSNRPPTYNMASVNDSGTVGYPAEGRVPTPAPEPSSTLLLLLGVGSLVAYRRRH